MKTSDEFVKTDVGFPNSELVRKCVYRTCFTLGCLSVIIIVIPIAYRNQNWKYVHCMGFAIWLGLPLYQFQKNWLLRYTFFCLNYTRTFKNSLCRAQRVKTISKGAFLFTWKKIPPETNSFCSVAYRVLQTIQTKLILLCVWAEPAVLGSTKTALKFKYEI